MSQNPERLILIHGAWAGAWVWQRLEDELGLPTLSLELPGNGHHPIPANKVRLDDYLDAVRDAIKSTDGPVGLVGHSGGGMLVSAAIDAFPNDISHAIWIAGMMLRDGESFDALLARLSDSKGNKGVAPYAIPTNDGSATTIPRKAAIHYFFHELPEDGRRRASAALTPQPVVGRRIPVRTGNAFDAIPKLYIQATQDRSVVPAAQSAMCRNIPNLTVVKMETGHIPHITRAKETGEVIKRWLRKASAPHHLVPT